MVLPRGVFVRILCAVCVAGLLFFTGKKTFAEPVYPDPTVNKATGGQPTPDQSTLPLQPLDVTDKPEKHIASTDFFYPDEQELSFHYGLIFVSQNDGSLPSYGGFGGSYLWQSRTHFHFESGLETTALGEGHLWTSGRWVQHFTDRLRPYYSVGIGLRANSSRALANFLDFVNYFVRGAYGAEYSFTLNSSIKGEIFAGVDSQGRYLFGPTIGYSYGF